MPELPEVENIRMQIGGLAGSRIAGASASGIPLRYQLSEADHARLAGSRIKECGPQRLGRYILIPLSPQGMLMIHLGMTGSLRLDTNGLSQKHDHVSLELSCQGMPTRLVYNDARRFGGMRLLSSATLGEAKAELGLGDEPTAPIEPKRLKMLYDLHRPIKPLLMDNALVTGIGNIYASEICHGAALSPCRLGSSLGHLDCQNLSHSMHKVITAAIANGGSTLRNYIHVDGSKGSAQHGHRVYGRSGERCGRCGDSIRASTQAGRATFHCAQCQL